MVININPTSKSTPLQINIRKHCQCGIRLEVDRRGHYSIGSFQTLIASIYNQSFETIMVSNLIQVSIDIEPQVSEDRDHPHRGCFVLRRHRCTYLYTTDLVLML